MSDPRNTDQADGGKSEKAEETEAEELPDGSGPASRPGNTGDPDQFQG